MSGIKGLKAKAKLSLDEMFEDKSVGKLDNQPPINTPSQQSFQMDKHPIINPVQQHYSNSNKNDSATIVEDQEKNEANILANQPSNHLGNELNFNVDNMQFQNNFQKKTKKSPTVKMTFNLTEEACKAFNDLYAHRMLDGRKTEKSEMICEAIDLLIKMENRYKQG